MTTRHIPPPPTKKQCAHTTITKPPTQQQPTQPPYTKNKQHTSVASAAAKSKPFTDAARTIPPAPPTPCPPLPLTPPCCPPDPPSTWREGSSGGKSTARAKSVPVACPLATLCYFCVFGVLGGWKGRYCPLSTLCVCVFGFWGGWGCVVIVLWGMGTHIYT